MKQYQYQTTHIITHIVRSTYNYIVSRNGGTPHIIQASNGLSAARRANPGPRRTPTAAAAAAALSTAGAARGDTRSGRTWLGTGQDGYGWFRV